MLHCQEKWWRAKSEHYYTITLLSAAIGESREFDCSNTAQQSFHDMHSRSVTPGLAGEHTEPATPSYIYYLYYRYCLGENHVTLILVRLAHCTAGEPSCENWATQPSLGSCWKDPVVCQRKDKCI